MGKNIKKSLMQVDSRTGATKIFSIHTGRCVFSGTVQDMKMRNKIHEAIREAEKQAYRTCMFDAARAVSNLNT